MSDKRIRYLTQGAVIAAIYVVLCQIFAPISFRDVQVRIAEGLTILPYFTPAAIPGLFIGCLLGNLLGGAIPVDVIFGSLATLIGALGTWAIGNWIRRHQQSNASKYLLPIPPIVANTLIIPFVLKYAYNVGDALPFIFVTVGAGEIISAGLFGYILMAAVWPIRTKLFGKEQ